MKIVCAGVVSLLVTCVLTGCSNKGPKLYSATGIVTYQGKPMEGVKVMFHPKGGDTGHPSFGTTDADGKFQLSTFGLNDGAYAGKYVVTMSKIDLPEETKKVDVKKLQEQGYGGGGMPGYESMMGLGKGEKPAPKNELPAKYGDEKLSGIEVEISASADNTFKFNLD